MKFDYKRTEAGAIPKEWKLVRLGDLSEFVTSGSRGWARYYSDSGALFVRSQNVRDGRLDFSDCQFVSPPKGAEGDRTRLRIRDLLITITGNNVGNVAMVEQALGHAYVSQHVGLVRLSEPSLAEYVCRYLSPGSPGNAQIFRSQSGQSKPGLSLRDLHDFQVALPPTNAEQHAIVNALTDVDALLGALDRLIAKKRELKRAVMQQLLSGQTRLPGFGPTMKFKQYAYGLIPTDWDVKLLKSVSTMNGRIGWQGLQQDEFTENPDDPFLITGMNFKNGKIRWDEVYRIPIKRYLEAPPIQLRPNDILMTKDGTIGKILYVDAIPYPGKASLNSHLLVFRPISGQFEPKFFFYQLGSLAFAQHVELHKSGSTFFGLTQNATGKYPAILPSAAEQSAIAEVLSDMDADLSMVEVRREKTSALKLCMMQELLTGRTRLVAPEMAHA